MHRKRQHRSKIQPAQRQQTNLCFQIYDLPAHRTTTKKGNRKRTPTNRTGKTIEPLKTQNKHGESRKKALSCGAGRKKPPKYECQRHEKIKNIQLKTVREKSPEMQKEKTK